MLSSKVAKTLEDDDEYGEYIAGLEEFESEKKAENDAKHVALEKKGKGGKRANTTASLSAALLG